MCCAALQCRSICCCAAQQRLLWQALTVLKRVLTVACAAASLKSKSFRFFTDLTWLGLIILNPHLHHIGQGLELVLFAETDSFVGTDEEKGRKSCNCSKYIACWCVFSASSFSILSWCAVSLCGWQSRSNQANLAIVSTSVTTHCNTLATKLLM